MSDLVHEISQALINESGFLESEEFANAVECVMDDKIQSTVDKAIDNADIPQTIKDEISNEIPDYDDDIEEIKGRLDDLSIELDARFNNVDLIKRFDELEKQNTRLFQVIE